MYTPEQVAATIDHAVLKPFATTQDVIDYCRSQRGTQFDPHLTDLLLENFDEVLAIREAYPDPG